MQSATASPGDLDEMDEVVSADLEPTPVRNGGGAVLAHGGWRARTPSRAHRLRSRRRREHACDVQVGTPVLETAWLGMDRTGRLGPPPKHDVGDGPCTRPPASIGLPTPPHQQLAWIGARTRHLDHAGP